MDRRNFIYRAIAGVAGVTAGIGATEAGMGTVKAGVRENHTVTYLVKGFTCVTCATGLEVMLLQQKGIARASASYPEAKVVIGFDGNLISETMLQEFIANCGFTAT